MLCTFGYKAGHTLPSDRSQLHPGGVAAWSQVRRRHARSCAASQQPKLSPLLHTHCYLPLHLPGWFMMLPILI